MSIVINFPIQKKALDIHEIYCYIEIVSHKVLKMKRTFLSLIICLAFASVAIAAEGTFTKDPTCPGGLYLYGPAEGFSANLYYSDDFGETLQIVVADTYMTGGIIGDPVPGYLISHYGSIQLSRDYGVSWEWMGATQYTISAGRYPGEIYTFDYVSSDFVIKYSTDYGGGWLHHYPVGLPENSMTHCVGNYEGEFYCLDVEEGGLYRSIDFADNFSFISTLPASGSGQGTRISKGAVLGELYFHEGYAGDLFFSSDTGRTFEWTHNFPDTNSSYMANQMQAGTQTGEVFILKKRTYWEGGGEIFIYYSDNYGYDFSEFHSFSTTVWLPYINLTPLDTLSFPASGGILEYNIEARVLGPIAYMGDIWCDVTLPNGGIFGPVLGPVEDLYMGTYWSANRDRELAIPANAPPGSYTLNAYIGEYDTMNPIIDYEDHLEFTKAGNGTDNTDLLFIDAGESFAQEHQSTSTLPEKLNLTAYPNPFNQTTDLSYKLQDASIVNLSIYDISGKRVADLVNSWRDAGNHEVILDATGLVSGIYFVKLQAGSDHSISKIVLIK
ncbi:hypothetical protein CEE37_06795 [candidate division LCP-89 bacterium B3_LCP]|uniref:Secretion system C-terminal sorting domain-containing protein n=1 Tax=candidate division LCP-89 bacterium B3_LCP TaxID=2012998 RepID=A0A532V0C5_UNCL8|nr:MAG: hypothetical protein CEE37_06795 [candidate division LCP-89 bacterium B3_LCP]